MTEYIVDASNCGEYRDGVFVLEDEYMEVPAEPVVRCRDCEFSMFNKECSRIDPWEDEMWFAIEPGGFCAWGERRSE